VYSGHSLCQKKSSARGEGSRQRGEKVFFKEGVKGGSRKKKSSVRMPRAKLRMLLRKKGAL